MTNHVHILVTPVCRGGVGRMMQALGRSYVRAVNDSTGRTGTLWEGRYKSCLVESEHYLLTCYRYIELNPVRAGMVARPEDYEWSSYGGNALGIADPVLTPHVNFLRLGSTSGARRARYKQLVAAGVSEEQLAEIRLLTQRQRAYGSDGFRRGVQKRTGQVAGLGRPGRPKKIPEELERRL